MLGTDLLQKALAAGCMPIRHCYLGAYMPSQHSRVHDHSSEPSRRLDTAKMLYWQPSAWGAHPVGTHSIIPFAGKKSCLTLSLREELERGRPWPRASSRLPVPVVAAADGLSPGGGRLQTRSS
eukprot:572288-Rhodomonas_salina.3